MRVVTAKEMRDIDQKALSEYGLPGLILMENAGIAVVNVAERLLGTVKGKRVTIVAGGGNNGGDGFVIARHLKRRGARVKVLLLVEPGAVKGDAAINLACLGKLGVEVLRFEDTTTLKFLFAVSDVVVDAVFGTGFHGELGPPYNVVFPLINDSHFVLAVDVPSGLRDTGEVAPGAVRAACTVTFGLPKLGQLMYPGAEHTGDLVIADIGLPTPLLQETGRYQLVTPGLVKSLLPRRAPIAHKGDFGRLLGIAGSRGMAGAAALAARAALRAGAGLVRAAAPASVVPLITAAVPEATTLPLPETPTGTTDETAVDFLQSYLPDAVYLGPGMGMGPGTARVLQHFLFEQDKPLVLDADALNVLADSQTPRKVPSGQKVVITPHPGEMARLLACSNDAVQSDRLKAVLTAALKYNCVTLLKGARTLITAPEGPVFINPTGNPGMATGGMGDVLTGVIGAFLAAGLDALSAAVAGAYIHGLAADIAAAELGMDGLVAGDVVERLPAAMALVRSEDDEDWITEIPRMGRVLSRGGEDLSWLPVRAVKHNVGEREQ